MNMYIFCLFLFVLEKYFIFARDTGITDKYWKESYGITFSEYLSILEYK